MTGATAEQGRGVGEQPAETNHVGTLQRGTIALAPSIEDDGGVAPLSFVLVGTWLKHVVEANHGTVCSCVCLECLFFSWFFDY